MPSPDAAMLGQFIETPVSYSTGVPSISVPIYTVTEGPLSLPISVNFHNGGLKVGAPASRVGYGWMLSAGGMITRTVRGIEDELSGYYHNGAYVDINAGAEIIDASEGDFDSEPDVFSVSYPGGTFQFYFDGSSDHNIITLPTSDVQIEADVEGGIVGFTLTDTQGIIYTFGQTFDDNHTEAIEHTETTTLAGVSVFASAWYLTRITTADNNFKIELTYEEENYEYPTPASAHAIKVAFNLVNCGTESISVDPEFISSPGPAQLTTIRGVRLAEINTQTTNVRFVPSSLQRDDVMSLNTDNGSNLLSRIEVRHGKLNGSFDLTPYCKSFDFHHSYTKGNKLPARYDFHLNQMDPQQTYRYRARLDHIQELDCSGAITDLLPHTFKYNFSGKKVDGYDYLPNRLTNAIDHWGYYNGFDSNNNNILNIPVTNTIYDWTVGNSDRNATTGVALYGSLKEHFLPTGGMVSYTMESNRVENLEDPRKITNLAPVMTLDNCNSMYDYTDEDNIAVCCGYPDNEIVGYYTFEQGEINDATIRLWFPDIYNEYGFYTNECAFGDDIADAQIRVYDDESNTFLTILSILYDFNNNPSQGDAFLEKEIKNLGISPVTQEKVSLVAGKRYRFELYRPNEAWAEFVIKVPTLRYTNPEDQPVGGLRASSIEYKSDISEESIVHRYTYKVGDVSTGTLMQQPMYIGNYQISLPGVQGEGYKAVSSPIRGLTDFGGSHIRYREVTKTIPGYGKSVYHYNIFPNQINPESFGFIYPPLQPEFRNDKLYEVEHYSQTGNNVVSTQKNVWFQKRIIAKRINDGKAMNAYLVERPFRTLEDREYCGYKLFGDGQTNVPVYAYSYSLYRGEVTLNSQKDVIDGVTTVTRFDYDSEKGHQYVTTEHVTNSDGTTYQTEYLYPEDFLSNAAFADMENNRNMLLPVATKISVLPAGASTYIVIGGNKTEYSLFGNFPRPKIFGRIKRTQDMNGNWIGSANDYITTGEILTYDDQGLISEFQRDGWDIEDYEWYPTGKLKLKKFKDFKWIFQYALDNTTNLLENYVDYHMQIQNFEYDNLMRLSKKTSRNGEVVLDLDYNYPGNSYPNNNHGNVRQKLTLTPSISEDNGYNGQIVYRYFDGLGRPSQTVLQGHHLYPDGRLKDVVANGVKYNVAGKPKYQFESFASDFNSGSFVEPNSETNAHTKFQYHEDPLSRIHKVTPPNWLRPKIMKYGANSEQIVGANGTQYSAGELQLTTLEDGNGQVTKTYTDKRGRELLVEEGAEVSSTGPTRKTYTEFDNLDRIKKVYPPGTTNSVTDEDLIFKYYYDIHGNLNKRKVPDRDMVEFYYDERDLLIYTVDPGIPDQYNYIATIYDDYGRIEQTGFSVGSVPSAMATSIEPGLKLTESVFGTDPNQSTFRRIVSSFIALLEHDYISGGLEYVHTYDPFGRLKTLTGKHHLSSTDNDIESTTYLYDAADNIVKETYEQVLGPNSVVRVTGNGIDHVGRINGKWVQVNANGKDGSRTQVSEIAYTVKDQLDQTRIGYHSENWLQKVDYSYLDNGFLTSINNVDNLENDLFAVHLNYQNPASIGGNPQPQYNGNISSITAHTASGVHFTNQFRYDNLNQLLFNDYYDEKNTINHSKFSSSYTYDLRGNVKTILRQGRYDIDSQTYGFDQIDLLTFDQLPGTNKIKSVTDAVSTPNIAAAGYIAHTRGDYQYDEPTGNMTYDPSRELSILYNYLNLPHTFTLANNTEIEYLYTADGTKVQERKVNTITGDVISQSDYLGPFEYQDGILRTILFSEGRVVPSIDCQQDLHLSGPITNQETHRAKRITADADLHTGGELNLTASEDITFKPGFRVQQGARLYAKSGPCYGPVNEWRFEYYLRDHLGNNRILFTDLEGDGTINASDIIQENHYYPFGLEMEGAWTESNASTAATSANRYRYNGKELNPELGLYDYGARWYDPAIARWGQIDPLADAYAPISPYAYVANNPIALIDPNGMSISVGLNGSTTATGEDAQDLFRALQEKYSSPDDIIHVDKSGKVASVEETDDDYNIFVDQSTGQRLHLNDPQGVDNDLHTNDDLRVGDRVFFNVEDAELMEAIRSAGPGLHISQIILKSLYGGADFTFSHLIKNYFNRDGKGQETVYLENGALRTHYVENQHYFRFGEGSRVFNLYDAGNYMWGAWMSVNGARPATAKIGSQLNELFRDTKADQRAILAGLLHYKAMKR